MTIKAQKQDVILNAAKVIREVSPFLAEMWMTKPFHRETVRKALFEKMKADDTSGEWIEANRVRRLLGDVIEALK